MKSQPKKKLSDQTSIINKITTFMNQELAISPLVRLNILAIIVGIVGGIGSWIFRQAILILYIIFYLAPIEIMNNLGFSYISWLPFLLGPIIGGALVGILTSRVSKETKGHGVPEVLESVALNNGRMRLRIPIIKIIASATTIGSGGSAGREGPIAQIGAGFASLLSQKLRLNPKEMRTLVVAGVAAGIAATFNAPIGGSLFALEVLIREGGATALFIPVIVAAVVGVVVGQFLLGTEPAFLGFPPLEYHDPYLIPLFVIMGIICGIGSALWIKFFYKSEDVIEKTFEKFKVPNFLQPALGGLFVGITLVLMLFVLGENWESYTIMGRTYLPMEGIFDGSLITGSITLILFTLISLLILKAVSTVFTIGTGGSGGVFAPTLFLG
ncbi:MAG: chloride channel protein, partial [Candidatus Hodarchaeota archaeon]